MDDFNNLNNTIAALKATSTHSPEQPNPAQHYLDFARAFSQGGLQQAMNLPNNIVGRALQNPDNLASLPGLGMAQPWLTRAKELIALGKTIPQAANELGLTRNQVGSALWHDRQREQGLARTREQRNAAHPVWSDPKNIDALTAGRSQGKTYDQIADELGITRGAVAGKLDRLGTPPGPTPQPPTLDEWVTLPDGTLQRKTADQTNLKTVIDALKKPPE